MARFAVGVSLVLLFVPSAVFAQGFSPDTGTGVELFSTQKFGIDLASSSITQSPPIRSKSGKIPVSYALVGNSHVYPNGTGLAVSSGFTGKLLAADFGYSVKWTQMMVQACQNGNIETYGGWQVFDNTGAAHSLGTSWVDTNGTCYQFPSLATTTDGSGITVTSSNRRSATGIYDKMGNDFGGSVLTDPDGATVTAGSGYSLPYTEWSAAGLQEFEVCSEGRSA
jgi:hypothetical protein